MGKSFLRRVLVWSFAAALAFSVVFTAVTAFARWPGLPYRALRDLDLAVGFAAVLGLLALAARTARGGRGN